MVNKGLVNCDMFVDGARCRNRVEATPEHLAHFGTMILGNLELQAVEGVIIPPISLKQLLFHSTEDRLYRVVNLGPSEIFYVDDVFGNGDKKGVIGRVGKENFCNAYSLGKSSFLRGQQNGESFSIECTPFQVYRVVLLSNSKEPREDSREYQDL